MVCSLQLSMPISTYICALGRMKAGQRLESDFDPHFDADSNLCDEPMSSFDKSMINILLKISKETENYG